MRIIAGSARGRRLLAPGDRSVRPALDRIRESTFSILAEGLEGSRVLDLFAGTGSLGLEALSRGAGRALFVERSRKAAGILKKNIWRLGFQKTSSVVVGDALRLPDLTALTEEAFDLVFLDPPFAMLSRPPEEARVYGRLQELRSSPALARSATLVLRLPSAHTGAPPAVPSDRREYGESTVLFFRKVEEFEAK
jgi:16S rRNA (guanine(966)-N(2))-methyltransferase RsmD